VKNSRIHLPVIDTVVDGCVESMVLNYVLTTSSTYFVVESFDFHLRHQIIALLSLHCVSMNYLQLSVVGVVVVYHLCHITFYKTLYKQQNTIKTVKNNV
jgi:hypothetical protein